MAAALCLLALPAGAENLNSQGGFLFDVLDSQGGGLSNDTGDAYDNCYSLEVNGATYNAGSPGTLEGRRVTMRTVSIGPFHPVNFCSPPRRSTTSGPGCSSRW